MTTTIVAEDVPQVQRRSQDDDVEATLGNQHHITDETPSSSGEPPKKESFQIPLVITVAAANFLNTLAVQSSVIILPSIGRELGIPDARQQWIISSYYMTYGCFLLLWGRIADLFGRRAVFIIGSVWVTACTIAIPFTTYEILFDALRGMQGLGGAANVSSGLGILGVSFEAGRAKDYAYSMYGAAHSLGTIMGILFGGVITQFLEWKWVFWIFGIIAGAVTAASIFVIPPEERPVTEKKDVDYLGSGLITGCLLLFIFTLSEAEIGGWHRPWIPVLLVVSVLSGAAFVVWQIYLERRTTRAPLLRMSIWSNTRFTLAQVVLGLFYGSFNNFLLFATYYYQDYLSKSIISTTLCFLPTGIVGLVGSFIAAKVMSLIRGDVLLTFSTLCLAVACLIFALPIPPDTSYWASGFIAMCLAALGSDLLAPSLTLFTALSLPPEDQALGGGVCNSVVQIGRVIALAVATAIQKAVEKQEGKSEIVDNNRPAFLRGLRAAQYFNFSLVILAAGVVIYAFRGGQKIGKSGNRTVLVEEQKSGLRSEEAK